MLSMLPWKVIVDMPEREVHLMHHLQLIILVRHRLAFQRLRVQQLDKHASRMHEALALLKALHS